MHDITLISTTSGVTVTSTEREVTFVQVGVQGPAGPSAHGALSGLADDDHLQYHTDARGDARYAPITEGVTNGDLHNHSGDDGDGGQIDYASLSGLPDLGTAAATDSTAYDPAGSAAAAVSSHAGGSGVHSIDGVTGLQTALDNKAASTHNHAAAYAPIANGVTNGDSHNHAGGDGAQIAYSDLSGAPTLGGAAALNVGTTAGTVAAGDDARLSDSRTPVGHTHATGDVTGFDAAALAAAPAETTSTVGALIAGAIEKPVPADADSLGLSDSAESNTLKKFTWANLKAALSLIYVLLSGKAGGQTITGGTAAADGVALKGTSASGTTGTAKAIRLLAGDNGVNEAATVLNNGNVGILDTAPAEPASLVSGTVRVRDGKVAVGKLASFTASVPESGTTGWPLLPTNISRTIFSEGGSQRVALNWKQAILSPSAPNTTTLWSNLEEHIIPASNTVNFSTAHYHYGTSEIAKLQGTGTLANWRSRVIQVDDYICTTYISGLESVCNKYGSSGLTNGSQPLSGISQHYGSGIVATAWGTEGIARTMTGCTGTITNAIAVGAKISNLSATSTIVNAYGVNIGGPGESWGATGPITNAYGAFIGAGTNVGQNSWSIFCESLARAYFAGNICVGVDANTGAKLTLMSSTLPLRIARDLSIFSDVSVSPAGALVLSSPLVFTLPASITPSNNGEIGFELTNNSTLTVRAKGLDGVVRSAALTLT